MVRILAGESSRDGPWRPGFVALLAELGMEAEARRELKLIAAGGLDPFRESLWLTALTYLTDASSALQTLQTMQYYAGTQSKASTPLASNQIITGTDAQMSANMVTTFTDILQSGVQIALIK